MFRNARFFNLSGGWPDSEEKLDEALAKVVFTPCGPLTEKSYGWEAPVETAEGRLCRSVGGADIVQLRTQSRLLPTAAINEAVEQRIAEFRERMGELPGPRERRRLKLETRDNLMPKALLRSERTRAFFLRSENVLVIDASSPTKTERVVEFLRASLGRLDVSTLEYRRPVGELIRHIFLGESVPGIAIGRECRMQDPADAKATVRFADMDLADANVRKHVRDGMRLTHLGIEFNNVMSCVIDENGGLGKIRLLGVDASEAGEEEDPLARFDAQFVLLSGTVRSLLATLARALA
jgi:recombination associated protein RdgC